MLEKIMLRMLCKKLGIERMELGDHHMAFTFSEKTPVAPEKIARLVQQKPHRFRMASDCILRARIGSDESANPIEVSKKVLHELAA